MSVILDYPEAREFDLGETTAASRQSSATAAPWATGITAFVKNGGYAGEVAAIANNASTLSTQLFDCRLDQVSLDEVEGLRLQQTIFGPAAPARLDRLC